jgi:hypothetical protein
MSAPLSGRLVEFSDTDNLAAERAGSACAPRNDLRVDVCELRDRLRGQFSGRFASVHRRDQGRFSVNNCLILR